MELEPGDHSPLTFRLIPGATVSGRVVDQEGRGVGGARIYVRPLAGQLTADRAADWPEHADEEGYFQLPGVAADRRFGLFAYRADRDISRSSTLEIENAQAIEGLEILLPEPAEFVVQLTDEEGAPVHRPQFRIRESHSEDDATPIARERLRGLGEGRYIVRVVRDGQVDLSLSAQGYGEVARDGLELSAGKRIDLGRIELPPGLTISGKIVDSAGEPLASAMVHATWKNDSGPRTAHAASDSEGHYRLTGLDPTSAELTVKLAGYSKQERSAVVPGSAEIDFELRSNGGVEGRVVTEDDADLAAFMIVIHLEHGPEPASDAPTPGGVEFPIERTFSDPEDGNFEFGDLPPGRYTVEARGIGYVAAREKSVEVEEGELTRLSTLRLERGLSLEGYVVRADDHSPIAGVEIQADGSAASLLLETAGQRQRAASDGEGHFRIEGLEAGRVEIVARHDAFAPSEFTVELSVEQSETDLTIELGTGGELVGVVRDRDGSPGIGRRLVVTRSLADRDKYEYAVTDAEGHYSLPRLTPGAYMATLLPGPAGPDSPVLKQATIREGETTELDFDESARILLSGQATRRGAPLLHAELFFVQGYAAADFKATRTDAQGFFEVGLDQPGRYRVMGGSGEASGGASTEIEVPDEQFVTRDVRFSGVGIHGLVRDADGNPIPNAVVSAVARGGGSSDSLLVAESDASGSYMIGGVQVGSYRVSCSVSGYRLQSVGPVEIEDASTEVEIDFSMQPGNSLRGRVIDDSGRGLGGVPILASPAGQIDPWGMSASTAVSDVNGQFQLTAPDDGALDITALPQGWAPIRRMQVAPPAEEEELLLTATSGSSVHVTLVDADGLPLAGLRLRALPAQPYTGSAMLEMFAPPKPTDASGSVTLEHLALGSYLLQVEGRPDAPGTPLTVGSAGESAIRIELP